MSRKPGVLIQVLEVDIHGALFYDLAWVFNDDPIHARSGRIGRESVYPDPQAGDKVLLHLVLGQVTRVEKRDA